MTGSYVLITAAVVLIVASIVLVLVLPSLASSFDLQNRVQIAAVNYANVYAKASLDAGRLAAPPDFTLGDPNLHLRPGETRDDGSDSVAIPHVAGRPQDAAPMALALVLDPVGLIVDTSYPARFPRGASYSSLVPAGKLTTGAWAAKSNSGWVTYALEPIYTNPGVAIPSDVKSGKAAVAGKLPGQVPLGWVYVQVPGDGGPNGPLGWLQIAPRQPQSVLFPMAELSVLLFAAILPVGLLFGFLTMRTPVRRLRRLASATVQVADGDLDQRVAVGGPGEVGQLEANFNAMAERLRGAVAEQSRLADETARVEERSRIARELHDAISQDLFSASLLAGGLQKALPADSPVQAEVRALRETLAGSMNEMRAMLLELRPAVLDERGLVPALRDLCAAYSERLGVSVEADLDSVEVAPPADHALLRIAQEGLANAVRHSEARRIRLRLVRDGDRAELTVADDGRGFDEQAQSPHGLGLRVMRERARELGGAVSVESNPGRGTELVAWLPSPAT
jgi:signal transduction histidine kinase/type II secretory pathway pseudopilin PulG